MTKTIFICDDDEERSAGWKAELEGLDGVKGTFVVERFDKMRFQAAVHGLEQRRVRARRDRVGAADPKDGGSEFDRADILIVDYDLFEFGTEADYFTGESVAYLVRCFSRCGIIVALNQYGENTFDLKLRGHPESFADLNVGAAQLTSPGLWSWPWSGFRPWAWPLLPQLVADFQLRVDDLTDDVLGMPILDFFGIPASVRAALPREAAGFIESKRSVSEATFEDFVERSGNALRGKDESWNRDAYRRIAAARLSKWLERHLLPGQDVLVDAPHLATRYPSLVAGPSVDVASWNATTDPDTQGVGNLQADVITDARFGRAHWLSRPAWYWEPLTREQRVEEVRDPLTAQGAPFVFAEDLSAFLPRARARGFVAELKSQFVRRFVALPGEGQDAAVLEAVEGVDYRPAVRFAR